MARILTWKYSAGYYLQPRFDALEIAPTASVYLWGVSTTAAHGVSIENLGTVHGKWGSWDPSWNGNGITLNDGGTIRNGNASNTHALIEAPHPIVVYNAKAAITNSALVTTD